MQQYTGDAYTADETEFNVFNTDQKLVAIEGLANVLASIPGRKALVEFTGGITQTGEENRAELQAATDAANRADISIYSIDARGMYTTPPGGDATTAAASGTSMFSGASVFHQTDQREDSRDTLATLSTDTGGRAFFDLGDLSDAFPKIQQENGGLLSGGLRSAGGCQTRRPLARRSREGQGFRRARSLPQRILRSARFPASRKRRAATNSLQTL